MKIYILKNSKVLVFLALGFTAGATFLCLDNKEARAAKKPIKQTVVTPKTVHKPFVLEALRLAKEDVQNVKTTKTEEGNSTIVRKEYPGWKTSQIIVDNSTGEVKTSTEYGRRSSGEDKTASIKTIIKQGTAKSKIYDNEGSEVNSLSKEYKDYSQGRDIQEQPQASMDAAEKTDLGARPKTSTNVKGKSKKKLKKQQDKDLTEEQLMDKYLKESQEINRGELEGYDTQRLRDIVSVIFPIKFVERFSREDMIEGLLKNYGFDDGYKFTLNSDMGEYFVDRLRKILTPKEFVEFEEQINYDSSKGEHLYSYVDIDRLRRVISMYIPFDINKQLFSDKEVREIFKKSGSSKQNLNFKVLVIYNMLIDKLLVKENERKGSSLEIIDTIVKKTFNKQLKIELEKYKKIIQGTQKT